LRDLPDGPIRGLRDLPDEPIRGLRDLLDGPIRGLRDLPDRRCTISRSLVEISQHEICIDPMSRSPDDCCARMETVATIA
jgi:hypothetical protein